MNIKEFNKTNKRRQKQVGLALKKIAI